jgi:CHAT domain/SIR2-like domain
MNDLALRFEVTQANGEYRVFFSAEGSEAVEARFLFDASPGTQVAEKLADIEANVCSLDDIYFVGEQMWLGLTSGPIKEAVANLRSQQPADTNFVIRLELPEALHSLPWEALYDRSVGSLAGAQNYCVVHEPSACAGAPDLSPRDADALRMLVIVPEGSGLNAEHEVNTLSRECSARRIEMRELIQAVTPDSVNTALAEGRWDIVHYVGHGRPNAHNRIEIMLNAENGGDLWLDAEIFAQDFRMAGTRLAVMNCCFSHGSPERVDSLNGLGLLLMRQKVPAVVAMRYAIADHMAIRFSQTLYRALLSGTNPGRIDAAVEAARAGLRRNQQTYVRSFITPVLHLLPGAEKLFSFRAGRETPKSDHKAPAAYAAGRLPDKLVRAIASRDCVPIVGPGILLAGAHRAAEATPGPRELAGTLADDLQPPYPRRREDFELCQTAGEWMHGQLLQWVCQHYERQPGGLADLIQKIAKIYGGQTTPNLVRALVKWDVPALFYTFFDGLLDGCVTHGESRFTDIVYTLDEPRAADSKRMGKDSLLILVRGSVANAKSLVLTESDHQRLTASIVNMEQEYEAIAKQVGRCALFLGVSPRDPLVRQLSYKLLESGRRRQGPTFFVSKEHTEVDDAYWQQFDVQWLDQDLEELIPAILEASR